MAKKAKKIQALVLWATGEGFIRTNNPEDIGDTKGTIALSIHTKNSVIVLFDEHTETDTFPQRWEIAQPESGSLVVSGWRDDQDRDEVNPATILTIAPGFWQSTWAGGLQDPKPSEEEVPEA